MANPNPIQVDTPVVLTNFQIPAANKNDMLTLTVTVTLTTAGWSYVTSNQVFLEETDKYPAGTPNPVKLPLGRGIDVNGLKLLLETNIVLIYGAGGNAGGPPIFKYNFSIDTNTTNISSFDMNSAGNNVTDFNSQILFSQL